MPARRTRNVARERSIPPPVPLRLRILGTARVMEYAAGRCSVGSAPGNDLVLDDLYVSARHCAIYRNDQGGWSVQDEGSRNGTWVNNLRVERCELESEGWIVVGRTGLQLAQEPQAPPCGLVGEHPSMLEVYREIRRFAPTSHPVMILGETGTGKELAARAVHRASGCHLGPFEAVNCASIPAQLAESELFGHVRGAFTGADRSHHGAFQRADGGTLFLDEVGEMPLELQPKLLRALEERCVRPVGASRSVEISLRVIAATHDDLDRRVERGRFRPDLYHRLAVGVIGLPPLRERRSDIRLLVRHFLDQERRAGGPPRSVADEAMGFLEAQHWAGNVRALRNALRSALVRGGPVLQCHDFALPGWRRPVGQVSADKYVLVAGRRFEEIRGEVYRRALEQAGGNRSAAAAALGIPKSTFFDQLRAMGMTAEGGGVSRRP